MGLLLFLFIHPPLRFKGFSRPDVMDRRSTVLALLSALLFFVTTRIPLAQELLSIDPLLDPRHYLIVVTAGLVWAVTFSLCLQLSRWIAGLLPS